MSDHSLSGPVSRGEALAYAVVLILVAAAATWGIAKHESIVREGISTQGSIERAQTAYANAVSQQRSSLAGCANGVEERAANAQRDLDEHDAWTLAAAVRRADADDDTGAARTRNLSTAQGYSDIAGRALSRVKAVMGPTIYSDYQADKPDSAALIPYLIEHSKAAHVGGRLTNCAARYPAPAKPKGVK